MITQARLNSPLNGTFFSCRTIAISSPNQIRAKRHTNLNSIKIYWLRKQALKDKKQGV